MFVEFVGLPGCGKTTVSSTVLGPLIQAGFKFLQIKQAADIAANKEIKKNRFLKRLKPRVLLYGTACFARDSPEVYDALFNKARHDIRQTMWLMNFFAYMYYANQTDFSDTYIFLDEGFVHRGAAAFFEDKSRKGFKRYLDGAPHSDLIISIEVPVQIAIERCRKRKSGIPQIYDGSTEEEVIKKFTHLSKLQKYAVSHQAKAGVPVVSVDGTATVEECCRQIFDAFMAL